MKDFGLDSDDSLDETCGIVYSTKRGKIVFDCALCEEAYSSSEDFLLHLSGAHLTAKALKQLPLFTDGSNEMKREIDYLDYKWKESDSLLNCSKLEEMDEFLDIKEDPISESSNAESLNSLDKVIEQEQHDDSEVSQNSMIPQAEMNEEYPMEKLVGDFKGDPISESSNAESPNFLDKVIKQAQHDDSEVSQNSMIPQAEMNEEYPMEKLVGDFKEDPISESNDAEFIKQEEYDDSEMAQNSMIPQVEMNKEYPMEKLVGDDELTIETKGQKSKDATKTTKLKRSCAERPRKYRKLDLEIQGRPIKCLTCPGIFANIEEFRNHLKDHVNYICTKCSGGFLTKRTFDLHMDGSKTNTDCAHLTRPYKCKYCDFGFPKKARMTIHMRLHFDESNFQCSKCPKSFQTKYKLKLHMNTHVNEKAFKCHICDMTMSNQANMISHIKRHSEDNKKFECEHCQKKFFTPYELGIHNRTIHTKERPYLCPVCGISFPVFTQLTLHQTKRHTVREKNMKCEFCSQAFFNRSDLRHHLITHSDERNHVCPVCYSTFKTAKTLKNHFKIHENKKLHKCDLCQRGFNQKPSLRSHLKIFHNINM